MLLTRGHWLPLMTMAWLGACRVAVVPDASYLCETNADCPGARCLESGACEVDAGSVDAGSVDAGSVDAGSVDAGSGDAGSGDGGIDAGTVETACANGLDDDGDLATDCADPDCVGRVCRAAANQCDRAEQCANLACPADLDATGDACDDADPCTTDDRCAAQNCVGTKSSQLAYSCAAPGVASILTIGDGGCVNFCANWAPRVFGRSIPDASLISLGIWSPAEADGGCAMPQLCADWVPTLSAPPPGAWCATNTVMFPFQLTPHPRLIPLYTYRIDGGAHEFSTDAMAPLGGQLEPASPVVYFCPL